MVNSVKRLISIIVVLLVLVIYFSFVTKCSDDGFDPDAEKFNPNKNEEQLEDFVLTDEIKEEINKTINGGLKK